MRELPGMRVRWVGTSRLISSQYSRPRAEYSHLGEGEYFFEIGSILFYVKVWFRLV